MRLFFKTLGVIILITFSQKSFAQQSNSQSKETDYRKHNLKMYDYEFSGEISLSQLELLTTEVSKMHFVTKAKYYYKEEKGMGQIRLFTDEYFINSDTDFEFDIYNLKMLLTKFNLTPLEYRSEVISNN